MPRTPEYISPSALKTWLDDPEEYYLKYLCDTKPPRFPQTPPMSVGSAFDAQVKAYMHKTIFGPGHPKAATYELRVIFEAQVEPHNHEFAWRAGEYVFRQYKDCGALADLMFEIERASTEPQFEVEIRGDVEGGRREGISRTRSGVPLFGKPDVFFMNCEAAHVVTDWKVNGYCSKSPHSPMAGYKMLRNCAGCNTRGHGMCHKDYMPYRYKGMEINSGSYLEQTNQDWAIQLATYGWLHGEAVGVEEIAAIDQIVCDARPPGNVIAGISFPLLRVASHRTRVSSNFQKIVMDQYTELWDRITRQPRWFFRELSEDQSQMKQEGIETAAKTLFGNPNATDAEQWLAKISRGG